MLYSVCFTKPALKFCAPNYQTTTLTFYVDFVKPEYTIINIKNLLRIVFI